MAATSIKIGEDAKARLEELQARIRLETGVSVTQQALLDRIIAGTAPEDLVAEFRDEFQGLDEEQREKFHSNTSDWGFDTADDDVDEILYGE